MSQFGSSISAAAANPRPTKPINGKSGLVIIGAGLGRTGTSSLQEALHILGYGPVYHMREVFKDPNGVSKWQRVAATETHNWKSKDDRKEIWDDIFWGYQATVDHPSCLYYKELMDKYPNAKVILTIRDNEAKWYESVCNTIAPPTKIWRFLYKITLLHNYEFSNMINSIVWKPLIMKGKRCETGESSSTNSNFNIDDTRNKEIMTNAYRRHNREVQQRVPSNNLLVFNVKDGWEPLCEFLNCPIPTTTKQESIGSVTPTATTELTTMTDTKLDFPHVWHSKQVQTSIKRKRQKCIMRLIIMGITTAAFVKVASCICSASRDSSGGGTRSRAVPAYFRSIIQIDVRMLDYCIS